MKQETKQYHSALGKHLEEIKKLERANTFLSNANQNYQHELQHLSLVKVENETLMETVEEGKEKCLALADQKDLIIANLCRKVEILQQQLIKYQQQFI